MPLNLDKTSLRYWDRDKVICMVNCGLPVSLLRARMPTAQGFVIIGWSRPPPTPSCSLGQSDWWWRIVGTHSQTFHRLAPNMALCIQSYTMQCNIVQWAYRDKHQASLRPEAPFKFVPGRLAIRSTNHFQYPSQVYIFTVTQNCSWCCFTCFNIVRKVHIVDNILPACVFNSSQVKHNTVKILVSILQANFGQHNYIFVYTSMYHDDIWFHIGFFHDNHICIQ